MSNNSATGGDDEQQKIISQIRTQSEVCQTAKSSSTKPEEYQNGKKNGFLTLNQRGQPATTATAPLCDSFKAESNA